MISCQASCLSCHTDTVEYGSNSLLAARRILIAIAEALEWMGNRAGLLAATLPGLVPWRHRGRLWDHQEWPPPPTMNVKPQSTQLACQWPWSEPTDSRLALPHLWHRTGDVFFSLFNVRQALWTQVSVHDIAFSGRTGGSPLNLFRQKLDAGPRKE